MFSLSYYQKNKDTKNWSRQLIVLNLITILVMETKDLSTCSNKNKTVRLKKK